MLRRRLSAFGRLAATTSTELLSPDESIPVVFASRHGDAHRTLELLQALASGDDVSPASFSMSVHNAVAGILSIARGDTSAVTAVAAADNLLLAALLEASAQLQDAPRVLCVLCDLPLPALYTAIEDAPTEPWALALLLERPEISGTSADRYLLQQAMQVALPAYSSGPALLPLLQGVVTRLSLQAGSPGWVLTRREEGLP